MAPTCPHCATSLDIEHNGAMFCPRCGQLFEVFEPKFEPTPLTAVLAAPEVAIGSDPAVGEAARCARHPANIAVANCVRCGDFACDVCLIVIEGWRLCPGCFDLEHSRGRLLSTQQSTATATAALVCGIVGLVLVPCLNWIASMVGLAGVVLGIVALTVGGQSQGHERGKAIAGIVLGVLSMIATVAWIAVMVTLSTRTR